MGTFKDHEPPKASEVAEVVGSARLIVRAADRMALGVRQAVKVGILSSRSEAADALLDYEDLGDHRAALGIADLPALEAEEGADGGGADGR